MSLPDISRWLVALSLLAAPTLTSCKAGGDEPTDESADQEPPSEQVSAGLKQEEAASADDDSDNLARPEESWVEERVDEARERLQGTEAGEIVLESIQAHGGLETWYNNGPVYFRYQYEPVDDGTTRDTYQTVDTWSSRARHQVADNDDHEYGWDGERAWYKPASWEPPYDVRFWALTPYYFMGMPFVLADPGVNLKIEDTDTILGHDTHVVRVTFGEVGIAPDDYYVIYVDRKTHQLRALRYVVSYPKYFPDGGHSPEKLMTYEGEQVVDNIVFAEKYRFFMWDADKKTDAKLVTNATLSDVEFRPQVESSFFEAPEDAEYVE